MDKSDISPSTSINSCATIISQIGGRRSKELD
jgi:hypothetical protein